MMRLPPIWPSGWHTMLPLVLTGLVWALSGPGIAAQPASAKADPLARIGAIEEEVVRLVREGHYQEAIPKARKVLALREEALGSMHVSVAGSLNELALLLAATGDYRSALPLYERALRIGEAGRGANHLNLTPTLDGLAYLHLILGDGATASGVLVLDTNPTSQYGMAGGERRKISMTKAARKSIEAIYEDGVFRPTRKVKLADRSRVRLTLVPLQEPDRRAERAQVRRQRRGLLKLAGIGASGQGEISSNPEQALYGSPRV